MYMCSMHTLLTYIPFLCCNIELCCICLLCRCIHFYLISFSVYAYIHKSRVFLLIPNAFGSNTISTYMNVRYSFVFSAPNKSHLNITRHKTRFKFVSVYHAHNLQYWRVRKPIMCVTYILFIKSASFEVNYLCNIYIFKLYILIVGN